MVFFYLCIYNQVWILGQANEAVAQGRESPSFESFTLSFGIVFLKSLLINLESHLTSSEASHRFFKIKQNCAQKCQNQSLNNVIVQTKNN